MSDIEEILTCPLGGECHEIRDGKLYRCRWYTKVIGTDAQGVSHDEHDCAISWAPLLTLELIRGSGGVQAAIESVRNVRAAEVRFSDGVGSKLQTINIPEHGEGVLK